MTVTRVCCLVRGVRRDVPDLDLMLPDNAVGLDDGAYDITAQVSAAWEAAICWDDKYAVMRLAEVRAVRELRQPQLPRSGCRAEVRTATNSITFSACAMRRLVPLFEPPSTAETRTQTQNHPAIEQRKRGRGAGRSPRPDTPQNCARSTRGNRLVIAVDLPISQRDSE